MSAVRKIWKFISSMRFAIALLAVLAVVCSVGSLITQGQDYAWYAQRYPERTAALILALHLDDAFHSWWFILINAFLCLNLLLCNVLRLPRLIARTRAAADPRSALRTAGEVRVEGLPAPEEALRRLRMPKPARGTTEDGRAYLFAGKHRAGLWGAWVCHLGILMLIAGFSLGQMTRETYVVYGVPGQTRPIGDTGYLLAIDDFRVDLREDDTVEQYTAEITVYNPAAGADSALSAALSVNNPASLFGMKFYQNSTGWAATVSVSENGEPLQEEIVCAGEYLRVSDKPDLVIDFNAFYPDYVQSPGSRPATASGRLNNPAYLYSVYYQEQMIGMNVLMADEALTIDDYTVAFSAPQSYTLIQIKKDRFTSLALAGGLVTMLGLLLAFYIQPSAVWAVQSEDGLWTLHGSSRKGGALFRERVLRAAGVDPANHKSENEDMKDAPN